MDAMIMGNPHIFPNLSNGLSANDKQPQFCFIVCEYLINFVIYSKYIYFHKLQTTLLINITVD
jgi:hypothetical protein